MIHAELSSDGYLLRRDGALYGMAWSRGQVVDLWYALIIADTVNSIDYCRYVEIGVDEDALSMRLIAPYAHDSHGCDIHECEVPDGVKFWHMYSNRFLEEYDGMPPQVVFIDGDHSLEVVTQDFQTVQKKWPKAIVFLHDTVTRAFDVWQLAENLEGSSAYQTFTWERDPGLTVVRKRC